MLHGRRGQALTVGRALAPLGLAAVLVALQGPAVGAEPAAVPATFAVDVTVNAEPTKRLLVLDGTEKQNAKFYPLRALQQRIGGVVRVRCEYDDLDRSNCGVIGESPRGMGFGDMALKDLKRVPSGQRRPPMEAEFRFLVLTP